MECTAKGSLVNCVCQLQNAADSTGMFRWWWRECACMLQGGVRKEWAGYGKENLLVEITDHFRRTELWRKTCNPGRQALCRVLGTGPSGQCSSQLDLEGAPAAAHLP